MRFIQEIGESLMTPISGQLVRRLLIIFQKSMMRREDNQRDEYGYPIHQEMNFLKPQGDFETRIALVIVFTMIIIGIFYGKF